MTHLLDLPNELLLRIAAALNMDNRRRFSKVCRRSFHLIRDQTDKSRYGTEKEFNSEWNGGCGGQNHMTLHHVSSDACVLRVGEFIEGRNDIRVIAVLSTNTEKVPSGVRAYLKRCTLRKKKIRWVHVAGDVLEESMNMMLQGLNYYDCRHVEYSAHYGIFNVPIAQRFVGLRYGCRFDIHNDFVFNEVVDALFSTLIDAFVKHLEANRAANARYSRLLRITDRFDEKSWRDQRSTIETSNDRLLGALKQQIPNIATKCSDFQENCNARELIIHLNGEGEDEAEVHFYKHDY